MNPADAQSDHQPPSAGHHRLTILRVLAMAVTTGALFLSSRLMASVPCWALFVVIGLFAWPVWCYRVEYVLLRRRLLLSAVARPQSRIRAWLWQGRISKAVQVVVSMFLVWLLFAMVSRLSFLHWIAFAADAVLLGLVIAPVSRRLSADITSQHLNTISRHWPLFFINGIVLSGAIMALDFFVVGAADTRHLDWQRVAVQAFSAINDGASCALWGVSAGGLAAAEALSWHASELVIPNLPDLTAKVIAWSFFLLRAVTLAYFFTALLLGVSVLLEKHQARRRGEGRGSTLARAFLLTIIVLALPFFYAAIKLSALDPAVFEQGVADAAALIDPCKPSPAAREQLIARLDKQVDGERRTARHIVDSDVDAGLALLFSDVEKGVDRYLDWYFTVIGEYQRLAAVFTDDMAASLHKQLEQRLFTRNGFADGLEHLDTSLAHDSATRFGVVASRLKTELDEVPCDIGGFERAPFMALERDTLRASAAAASGVGAGIVASKVMAKKTAAAVAGKLATMKSLQTGAALTSKTLAKKGSSSLLSTGLGTALCAPSGPVAILCGVTAGLLTWFTVDKALVELDESLNREAMRADLLAVLDEQQAMLSQQLKQKHYARIDVLAGRANDALQRTFVPNEAGMGDPSR